MTADEWEKQYLLEILQAVSDFLELKNMVISSVAVDDAIEEIKQLRKFRDADFHVHPNVDLDIAEIWP